MMSWFIYPSHACACLERAVESPPNRAHANLVFRCKLWDCRTLGVAIGNHALLAVVQGKRSSELLAKPLCPLDTLVSAETDQVALELRNAAEDRQHQLARR